MPREGPNGWVRVEETYNAPVAAGTGAEEYVTDLVLPYTRIYERVRAIVEVVGAGAGATRLFRLIKGTSTVVASATITLAGTATKGTVIDFTMVPAECQFFDADLLSLDVTAAGTQFTALTLQFQLLSRQRAQQVT